MPDSHFSEKMSAFFFKQILDGLEGMHSKGFVHLDLKPENILITKYLEAKIADFGLSAPLIGEDGNGVFM
jgi:serine/threonine protein kinase